MTSIDTNVSNYTLTELMAIVELTDLDHESIIKNTNQLIKRFKGKNPELSVFFQAIQSQLLQYADGLKDPNDNEDEDGEDGDENDALHIGEPVSLGDLDIDMFSEEL